MTALVGLTLGAGLAVVVGVWRLSFYGFWGGLMWPLLIWAGVALWITVRKQKAATETVTLAAGTIVGMAPVVWLETRGMPFYEVWFPLVMGLLLALGLSPLYVAIGIWRTSHN